MTQDSPPHLAVARRFGWPALVASLAVLAGGCGTPPPPAESTPAPVADARPTAPPAPVAKSGGTGPRLAPRDPALEAWKVAAAQKIHAVNQKQVFEGRPHHLLKSVIVVEATVDRSGNVVGSRVTRSNGYKDLDKMALNSLKGASPLPSPPASLVPRGTLVYSETWLVQNDGRFQVRTLALPQD
ncbi:MAG TPA: TonB family protein [Burkholderiaceae bacterium]|nr:TonB family protein [Burkholderiaceae bacterium]HQR76884.1 TonB family protein [Burkholderiaceae bacterium]